MKKNALIIISVVSMLILSVSIFTYAFFSKQDTQLIISFDASKSAEITLTIQESQTNQFLVPTTKIDGSYTPINPDAQLFTFVKFGYDYLTSDAESILMSFTVNNIQYKSDLLSQSEVNYFNSLFQFSFLEISDFNNDNQAINDYIKNNENLITWYSLGDYADENNKNSNDVELKKEGKLALLVRLQDGISSELVPESLYRSEITLTIIAKISIQ